MNDLEAAAGDLAGWAAEMERKAQTYQELHGRMAAVSITETSADRRVSVTVDANGVTTAITLAPALRGADPAAIAGELMACTRRAQARLRARVTELVHDTLGTDSVGETIVGQYAERFPDPADLEAPPTPPATPTPPAFPVAPPAPAPGTRAPGRDHAVTPEEPSEDDLYFRRRSWLE
ncbi:YbaB/EbfC family nucleoid-associated protein [Nocardia thailandica]|uniref:YbaB/EbfC family nucleoid-associated protein n=1 Tax=Nocardia thailandica TaxID=257275 RepID=UPI0002F5B031|nr:YbaB/EbfC family nucleoid-associated protein [Nocardia thailandica]